MTTQNSAMGDEKLRKIVEDSIRHARANVGFTLNSHEAAEQNISMNVETIMVAITSRDQQIALAAQVAKLQGELLALNYSDDAFHDLAAPDLEKWFLSQRDRLDEELAELKQAQNKEK